MTTLHLCYRPSSVIGRGGKLYFRVYHQRRSANIAVPYELYPEEWDAGEEKVHFGGTSLTRRALLRHIHLDIEAMRRRILSAIHVLHGRGGDYSAADVAVYYHAHPPVPVSLFGFLQEVAEELWAQERYSTYRHYLSTLHSIRRFTHDSDLSLDDITPEWLKSYEHYLQHTRKLCRNSSSFYLRVLRAVYNRAVRQGVAHHKPSLFSEVYTGVDTTVKRALTEAELLQLHHFSLHTDGIHAFAIDLFLLSYYLRGMALVDLVKLRKSNIQGDILTYRRSKTGQTLTIRWLPCMQSIVAKYAAHAQGDYLLPLILQPEADSYPQYLKASAKVNHALRGIGRELQFPHPLTLYCARHSWGSIAWRKGVDMQLISEALGHRNIRTTEIYMNKDIGRIHQANEMVLRNFCENSW